MCITCGSEGGGGCESHVGVRVEEDVITCGSEGGGGCVSHVGVRVEEDVNHMWELGWRRM